MSSKVKICWNVSSMEMSKEKFDKHVKTICKSNYGGFGGRLDMNLNFDWNSGYISYNEWVIK